MTTLNYVSFPGLGIVDLPVDRIAFKVFGLPIFWYGILIALAVLVGVFLGMRHAPRYGLAPDDVLDVIIAVIPMAVVFARLYYVVFSPDTKWTFLSIVDIRTGGLAFYGGVIGGILGVLLVGLIKRIRMHRLMDFLVVYLPLGQAIGRLGNFFNQEAFGNNTTLPWGMKSQATVDFLTQLKDKTGIDPSLPVHPTFFYEFLANLAIFVVLLLVRRRSRIPFETTLLYLAMYGFVRFFVENIRTDPLMAKLFGIEFRISSVVSALMFLVSIVVIWILHVRADRRAFREALQRDAAQGTEDPDASPEAAGPEEKDGPSGS